MTAIDDDIATPLDREFATKQAALIAAPSTSGLTPAAASLIRSFFRRLGFIANHVHKRVPSAPIEIVPLIEYLTNARVPARFPSRRTAIKHAQRLVRASEVYGLRLADLVDAARSLRLTSTDGLVHLHRALDESVCGRHGGRLPDGSLVTCLSCWSRWLNAEQANTWDALGKYHLSAFDEVPFAVTGVACRPNDVPAHPLDSRVAALYDKLNSKHFAGALPRLPVLIGVPVDADCRDDLTCLASMSQFGRYNQDFEPGLAIYISSWLFEPMGCDQEARWRMVENTLLHDLVHVSMNLAIIRDGSHAEPEDHGPRFAAACNKIGRLMGWDEVRSDDEYRWAPDLASEWPDCVNE